MVKVTGQDNYIADENIAYLIDYKVKSSEIEGTMCTGSIYIHQKYF